VNPTRGQQVRRTEGAADGSRVVQAPRSGNARGEQESGWRPYRFRNLERVSRSQAMLSHRMQWLMPAAVGPVVEGLIARVRELLEADMRLMLDYVHVIRPGQMNRLVGDPTFLAVLAPAPHKTRGFLEIELGLAHAAIDKLLGGAGDAIGHRPLTDIEEGVMSYIILEALKTLAPNLEQGLPRLRLEGTVRSVDDAMVMLGDETQVLVTQFKGTLGGQAGFLRLFLPASIVGLTNPPQGGPERRARRAAEVAEHGGRLSSVRTWLRAEIGRAELTPRDLAGLRTGDVVLVDEVTARPDRGGGGVARLRVGRGLSGWIESELQLEADRFRARLDRFVLAPAPREMQDAAGAEARSQAPEADPEMDPVTNPSMHLPGEGESEHVSENGEGVDLLNDIPLQVAVELGRVPVSAEEVIGLKVGQVIDLNRVPGEPVEMSVNGKVVARGELVEIEGHLGVRILSLIG